MKNRINHVRTLVLALSLIAISALVHPATATAQTDCTCDSLYLKVDPTIPCQFKVCIKQPTGFQCYGVGQPGGLTPIACNGLFGCYIVDCNGNFVLVNDPSNGNMVPCVCVGPGCCVKAFLAFDIFGCPVIKFEPADPTCVC